MSNNSPFRGDDLGETTTFCFSEPQRTITAAVNALQRAAFTVAKMNGLDEGKSASLQRFAQLHFHIHAALLTANQQLDSQRASGLKQEVDDRSNVMIPGPRSVHSIQFPSAQPIQSCQLLTYQSHIRPLNAHVDIAHHFGRQLQAPFIFVPAGPGYSNSHAPRTRFGDQQSDPRRRLQIQINYLDALSFDIPHQDAFVGEVEKKEEFRLRLTRIGQNAIGAEAEARGLEVAPRAIEFRCFGSYRNGFALPGSDMDLATIIHSKRFPEELQTECPMILTKAFLEAGLGAHLIDKARIPVIKLCENPPAHLLHALKAEYLAREKEIDSNQGGKTPKANDAIKHPPTHAENRSNRSRNLAFPKSGTGIECDINFSGRLALYNSELLRCYSLCDDRVRTIGLFIKQWAKVRDINNPFYGTLCSYGYLLMVVHYLTNVAEPPVTPNLQLLYRPLPPEYGRKETVIVEGCDVRFFRDEHEIRWRIRNRTWAGNRQSTGDLLRGFFAYYGSAGPGAPQGGFGWARNVVSIRTQGGILTKAEKGWTKACVDDQGISQRYLLAVEDPFEWKHNVGRTVRERGVHAIRAEFRRANMIINRIQEIPGAGWQWRNDEGEVGEPFFAPVGGRTLSRQKRSRSMRRVSTETFISQSHQANNTPGLSTISNLRNVIVPIEQQTRSQALDEERE